MLVGFAGYIDVAKMKCLSPFVSSGIFQKLLHQFRTRHSPAMARWYMPAFWMEASPYLML